MVRSSSDEDAFSAFVAARGPSLLRTAYLLTGNTSDAEDLLQGVLAKTYARWSRVGRPDAVEAYVRVALARTAANSWRRRGREFLVGEAPEQAAPTAASRSEDEMWGKLAQLPPRQRAVLVLRYYTSDPDLVVLIDGAVAAAPEGESSTVEEARASRRRAEILRKEREMAQQDAATRRADQGWRFDPPGITADGEAPMSGSEFVGTSRWIGKVGGSRVVTVHAGREGTAGDARNGRLVVLVHGGRTGRLLDSPQVPVPPGHGALTIIRENAHGTVAVRSADGTAYTFDPVALRLR